MSDARRVVLHLKWEWTCPDCKTRSIIDCLRHTAECDDDGEVDEYIGQPRSVLCEKCLSYFESSFPSATADDELE